VVIIFFFIFATAVGSNSLNTWHH